MKTYKVKTVIPGYKLGLDVTKTYIAVPSTVFAKVNTVYILYKDNQMLLTKSCKCLLTNTFKDQYGRDDYTLNYYEYIPELKQLSLLGEGS